MADEEIYHPPSQFKRLFISAAHIKEDIKKTVEASHKLFAQLER
ncbi:hypothetical protein [Cytobacillus praedii]|nr:hypothetical protein [Cytobacillus praedii]